MTDDFDLFELEVLRSKSKDPIALDLEDDYLVCECNCISYKQIKSYLEENDVSVSQMMENLNLGTGCKSCIVLMAQLNLG